MLVQKFLRPLARATTTMTRATSTTTLSFSTASASASAATATTTTTTKTTVAQYLRERREQLARDEELAAASNKPWRLVCTGIVYRQPVVTPEIPQWRHDFEEKREEYELKLGRSIHYSKNFWNVEMETTLEAEGGGADDDEEEEGLEKRALEAAAAAAKSEEEEKTVGGGGGGGGGGGEGEGEGEGEDDEDKNDKSEVYDVNNLDDDFDDDLEDIDFPTMQAEELDRVWDAEADEEEDEEREEEIFDTFGGFNFSKRITTADERNDYTSLERRLDQVLYLLVKGEDGGWRFPQRVMVRLFFFLVCFCVCIFGF